MDRFKEIKPRTYLDIIAGLLTRYNHFNKQEDIIEYLGSAYVKNITDTTDGPSVDYLLSLPSGFIFSAYEINTEMDNDVTMDIIFFGSRLVNFRCQLIAQMWNKVQFNSYVRDELFPVIDEIIGSEILVYDTNTGCYHYDNYNGYIIAIHIISERKSISVYLMDKNYA